MQSLMIGCLADSDRTAAEALILCRSLRVFGGVSADLPLLVMVPGEVASIDPVMRGLLLDTGADLIPFSASDAIRAFPFGAKVIAAAAAEAVCTERGIAHLLWMDSDSVILHPLDALRLDPGHLLSCRPVDHILIGPRYGEPLDPFWQQIDDCCGCDLASLPPVTGTVDGVEMYPYYNAGMLLVRPEARLLSAWAARFEACYRLDTFRQYYEQNQLYAIFVHQAILAGVIAARLTPSQVQPLPLTINYPMHMHMRYPAGLQAASLDDLITCRCDTLFDTPGWRDTLPPTSDPDLLPWIEAQAAFRARWVE